MLVHFIQKRFPIYLVAVICVLNVNAHLDVDEKCVIDRTRQNGVCRLIKDCPAVVEDLQKHRIYPTLCGFMRDTQIVCCPQQISVDKCAEYHKTFEAARSKCTILTSAAPITIANGRALSNKFPHMALLGHDIGGNVQWKCNGALIDGKYVLTSASCAQLIKQGVTQHILLGDTMIGNDEDDSNPLQLKATHIIQHPDYNPLTLYNDIALVKLERGVIFSDYIRPACLPDHLKSETENVLATGWSIITEPDSRLLKERLKIHSNQECNAAFSTHKNLLDADKVPQKNRDNMQMCAEHTSSDLLTGTILQDFHQKLACMYSIHGILSFGSKTDLVPDVYTRILPYLPWIESVVWP